MVTPPIKPLEHVSLSERTTLGVGGAARHWFEAHDVDEVRRALAWARDHALGVEILGGGSNVLIADRGLDALVLRVRIDTLRAEGAGDELVVDVGAGFSWDTLVAWAVDENAAGIECLSGIPGDVGAAPIQNIGAYGQELSECIVSVKLVDRNSGDLLEKSAAQCGFSYRDSVFKRDAAGRYVVVGIRLRLARGGAPAIRYPELARAVADLDQTPTLAAVRATVIELRRRKSMVLDSDDENRRSAGSFFLNPIVPREQADEVADRVQSVLRSGEQMPRYDLDGDQAKLSAAWLIERAGMGKGTVRGKVGISTRHSLALVNRGGATAREMIAFAAEVRACVRDKFGVRLTPEPQLLGFRADEIAALFDE